MPNPTDWKARITDLHVRGEDGEPLVIDWLEGSDDVVSINLADVLDEGETLDYLTVAPKMARMYTVGELADTDVSNETLIGDAEVQGTRVLQRVSELQAGYYYKFSVLHGAAANRRGHYLMIRCVP
jgi:hypothetical protein